jgi:ATP synthase protein I
MLRLLLTQLATTLAAAALAGLIAGPHAFFSAMFRLHIGALKPGALSPMTFFIGEFIKIAMTVALLAAVAWWYRDLNWLALIAAFIIALKSYIILLFRH